MHPDSIDADQITIGVGQITPRRIVQHLGGGELHGAAILVARQGLDDALAAERSRHADIALCDNVMHRTQRRTIDHKLRTRREISQLFHVRHRLFGGCPGYVLAALYTTLP